MGHAKLDVTQNTYTDTQKEYVESFSAKITSAFDTKQHQILALNLTLFQTFKNFMSQNYPPKKTKNKKSGYFPKKLKNNRFWWR